MKYFLFLFCLFATVGAYSQNPLKKELKGNSQKEHYSPSTYNFEHQKDKSIFIKPIVDNRSANWNKQINDSVRIDLIRDFWVKDYTAILMSKIEQDIEKSKVKLTSEDKSEYSITPTVDIHFPDFIVYPKNGYKIMTKINMVVAKAGITLFTKAYLDYYFFTDGTLGYKSSYDKDMMEGTNVGMWIGMQHVLDKFYADLDKVFNGEKVESEDVPLEVASITSNIATDPNLVNQEKPYSKIEDKSKTIANSDLASNNYKANEVPDLPPPTDKKLEKAIDALNIPEKKEEKKVAPQGPTAEELAARKKAEEEHKRAIDSAIQAKAELAKIEEAKKVEAKKIAEELAKVQQAKKDSIQQANQILLANKIAEKRTTDSLKKIEVNEKLALAKQKQEEKRNALLAKEKKIKEELAKKKAESEAKAKEAKLKLEAAQATASNTETPKTTAPKYDKKNVDIAEAIKRIAREVEEEDRNNNPTSAAATRSTTAKEMASVKVSETDRRKEKMDSLNILREEQRKMRLEELAEQKAAIKVIPIDPKKYIEDSIEFARTLEKRKNAIIAAQKSAIEAEQADLMVNPNAGQMFASVSTDPPNLLPDSRTAEERKRDRIFTPKNEISKQLLSRVKMVTPEEEMKLLANINKTGVSNLDSLYIAEQINKPEPPPLTITEKVEGKVEDAKDKLIDKKLDELKSTEEGKTEKIPNSLKKAKEDAPKVKQIVKAPEEKAKEIEADIEKKKEAILEKVKNATE